MTSARAFGSDRPGSSSPCFWVLATLGMLLMISANDLISLYLSLELQSLALYVVRQSTATGPVDGGGPEVFRFWRAVSGMMLYGMSLVYGFTGHTGFDEIAAALTAEGRSAGPRLRAGVHSCRPRLQDLRRPLPYVDAGRLRGAPTPVTAFFAADEGRGHIDPRAHRHQRLRAGGRRLAADRRLHLDRHRCCSAPSPRSASATQAADGLFLDRHMGYALVGLAAGSMAGVRA